MLSFNGSYFRGKQSAGVLHAIGGWRNQQLQRLLENRRFGADVSAPQGYQSAAVALIPTFATSGQIAARLVGAGAITPGLTAVGNMSATLSGESIFTANGNMAANIYASLTGEGNITATLRALGNMRATLDAGARPSAYDIAQEVWQTQAAAVNSAGTTGNKLNSAGSGGVDLTALAAAVWAHASRTLTAAPTGSGLTTQQALELNEIFKLHGLDIASPLVVTTTSRTAGDIAQTITDASGTTTVTRTA